jgi:hypothetical protein
VPICELRNHAKLLGAYAGFSEGGEWRAFADFRFVDYPVLSVVASEALDGVACARAVAALQALARRIYSVLKYGRPRRLTKKERAEVKIRVKHLDEDHRLDVDFTRPLNASLRALDQWDERALHHASVRGGMFAHPPGKKESWERTARESILAINAGLSRKDRRQILMLGMLLIAGLVGEAIYFKESFAHDLAAQEASYKHQRTMAELERTSIVTCSGERGQPGKALRELEQQLDNDARRARMLVSGEIDHPLLRFVAAEAKPAQASLLDLAPSHGWLSINGFKLSSEQAAVGAKAARKQIARNKPAAVGDGWTVIVQRASDPVDS